MEEEESRMRIALSLYSRWRGFIALNLLIASGLLFAQSRLTVFLRSSPTALLS